jgi:hypothetical protein
MSTGVFQYMYPGFNVPVMCAETDMRIALTLRNTAEDES